MMRTGNLYTQHSVLTAEHPAPAMNFFQMKLGRSAVGSGVRKLATDAGVAPPTIDRLKSGRGDMHSSILNRVQHVL